MQVLMTILGVGLSVTAIFCMVIYPLYYAGLLTLNTKRALMFVGRIGGSSPAKAQFTGCSGTMRRIMRFEGCSEVEFALGVELEEGKMVVELVDVKKKTLLMSLDAQDPIARVAVDRTARYELRHRFTGATGKCELRWAKTA